MPNPNPTSNRALVRYRIGADEPVTNEPPTSHNILLGTTPKVALAKGAEATEEIELDPPTNSIAEVEKRWQEENEGSGKEWVDADLLGDTPPRPLAEPVLAVPPPQPEVQKDQQILRERARGRDELPPTVTEDDEIPEAEGTAKPVKKGAKGAKADEGTGAGEDRRWGDGKHPLSYFADRSDDDILKLSGIGPASLKEIRDAQAAKAK